MGTSATRAKFQSTPPVRGATLKPRRRACFQNISIHAPRAGGDAGGYQIIRRTQNISIHAPRAGGDAITRSTPDQTWTFQSTPPVRGATWRAVQLRKRRSISIHAPRAGGDDGAHGRVGAKHHFNPRPPCGGRLIRACPLFLPDGFQSTPPVRGATLRAGRQGRQRYFNPRPPCGGRR